MKRNYVTTAQMIQISQSTRDILVDTEGFLIDVRGEVDVKVQTKQDDIKYLQFNIKVCLLSILLVHCSLTG